ncbi:AAA family ATPase [Mesorhizobium sp. M7A.F.Ca.MR.245.00.0.0]|uniref:AAA family ATPase n=1 Tax=Mesorhizobium sp. M7A.F.Ca.MR.245.00.0.0 TaxID=2496778 RepID=UPI000FCB84C7|nr:AAA family ATPase [Mesorhizobium sp. M7A.F.Ca.MR.245.00.0.0]RUV23653.1 hypothetical protein EOB80_00645 [Mesorhizobium sp. M7A.F.Ca.MR.245.00.0.0]RUV53660.1 hypothetical protein EOB77_01345 [Mesorhizobium sp. M7A.F.Ca.MR.228.00.0.0]
MRLSEVRVYGLFGLFDHVIPLNLSERITILHAPNGFGKTVVLKLISGMFGGSLSIFRDIEFATIEYQFESGSVLRVEQTELQPELFADAPRRDLRRYRIELIGGSEPMVWDPDEKRETEGRWEVSPANWERYLPFVRRVSTREWLDTRIGDTIGQSEMMARYADRLPPSMRRRAPLPEWLESVRASLRCRLIETQRLVTYEKKSTSYGQSEPAITPAVHRYSTELQSSIERLLAESATLSQALDQTFPNRLLQRMQKSGALPSEHDLRERLSDLEEQRLRLAKVGLLDSAKDSTIVSDARFDDATLRILTTYVEDTTAKLSIYEDTLQKIELFLEIINSRFQFKSISISRSDGFVFKDIRGKGLKPENLSSGEQHELILIYDLIFQSKKDTLILIDEPEISLHIAWQKRFLSDLRRIIELTQVDAVVSTHSPQLIGRDLNLTVQLQPPANDLLHSK